MEVEELFSRYYLNDGEINLLRINLNYLNTEESSAFIELKVRKPAGKKKFKNCKIELRFEHLKEVIIVEDLDILYYSDITFKQIENGFFYLSLDPYGNSGEPHEEDNLVFIAGKLNFKEIEEG